MYLKKNRTVPYMKAVDMHCDTIEAIYEAHRRGENASLRENDRMVDLKKLRAGDYELQTFALFTHLEKAAERPFEYCMELLDTFYEEMEAHREWIGPVRCYEDILENRRQGRMSALLSIEEGAVCQGKLALLRDFYRLGVRMMTLTWNYPNELGWPSRRSRKEDGSWLWLPETERGLTETGLLFLEEMERLGIIIDVSHLGDAGIRDVLLHTKKPFVASHSNARALRNHPRNLTDEMIRQIGTRGGVIGINYCPYFLEEGVETSRISGILKHMEHIKKVGGIGCLGLGSDFDGIVGELEIKDASCLPALSAAMEKAGFSTGEIEAVFGGNALRLFKELL